MMGFLMGISESLKYSMSTKLLNKGLNDPKSIENIKNIKIFDTYAVKEISEKADIPETINEELAKEIREIFQENIFIIPIFKKSEKKIYLLIFEVEVDDQDEYHFEVTLHDKDRDEDQVEGEENQDFEYASDIIFAILHIIVGQENVKEYENKIITTTDTLQVGDENDMIPAILQIAESKVLHQERHPNETIEESRHKILDRIIAFNRLITEVP